MNELQAASQISFHLGKLYKILQEDPVTLFGRIAFILVATI
jgi:hypothetical protein